MGGKLKFEFPSEIDLSDYERYFKDNVGLYGIESSRVSELLRFQIYCGYKYSLFNAFAVTDAMAYLEGRYPATSTKAQDSFRHLPLRGLKKKHWMDAQQLYRNTILELKEKRLDTKLNRQIQAFFDRNNGKLLDEKLIGEMAHIYTIGAWESRAERKALTGHWLIYAEYEGRNYYLSIATHDEGDEQIYQKIQTVCFKEFEFLEAHLNDPS